MELKWLEDFLAIAGSGSFSRAAESRHVTQPAFSRRLKALETWLGVPLVDRSSYPITLTAAGQRFRAVAETVVRELHSSREAARAEHLAHGTALKFAMPHALAVNFFPEWWREVSAGVRAATAKVVADNLHDCVQLLVEGGCQFLLCYRHESAVDPLAASDFSGLKVGEDVLMPVTARDGKGAPLFALPGTPRKRTPFLGYAPDAFLGKVTAEIVRRHRESMHVDLRYESAFAEALRAEAVAGAGVAWLPRKLAAADLAAGRLAAIPGPAWQTRLEVWLYRPADENRPAALEVWAAAQRKAAAAVLARMDA
jgi:DNA-binding transcriptional LysR family regulator